MTGKTFELEIKDGTLIIPKIVQNYLKNSQEKIKVSLIIESVSQESDNLQEKWQKWFQEVDKIKAINEQIEDNDYQQLLIDKYKKEGLDL